jgi:hypothetical protein
MPDIFFLITRYIAVESYVKIIYFAFMIYSFYLENSAKTAYLKTQRNHVRFRKYMVLERLNLR